MSEAVNDEPEMIRKDEVDKYIQDTINAKWEDKIQREKLETQARHEREDAVADEYTSTMKDSPEPWVDLKGYQETENGLKIALDWNDAFIDHLRAQGLVGVSDDDIVHKYLSLLMRQVTDETDKGDFEG